MSRRRSCFFSRGVFFFLLSSSSTILRLLRLLPSTNNRSSSLFFVHATIYTQEFYNSTETYDFIDSYPSLPALFGRVLNPHVLYTGKVVFVQADPYLCGDNNNKNNNNNLYNINNNENNNNNNNNNRKMNANNHNGGDSMLIPDMNMTGDSMMMHNNNDHMNMNNNRNEQHDQQEHKKQNLPQSDNVDDDDDDDNSSSSIIILLAARGECPFQRKAVVAESYGSRVQFLIIYNYANSDPNDSSTSTSESQVDTLIPMYADAYGPGARTRLGLLSVTHRTGAALKRYIREYQYDNQNQQQQQPTPPPRNGAAWNSEDDSDAADDSSSSSSSSSILLDGPWLTLNADPPLGLLTVQDLQTMLLTSLGLFFVLVSFTGCFLICAGTLSGAYVQQQQQQQQNANGDAWRNAAPPHVLHLPPDLLETLQHDEEWQARIAQLAAATSSSGGSGSAGSRTSNGDLSRDVSILAAMARGRRGLQSPASSSSSLLTPDQVRRLAAASSAMSRRRQQRAAEEEEEEINGQQATAAADDEHEGSGSTDHSEAPCCAVCLDELDRDDTENHETVILPCNHAFHMHCIMPWLTERQAKCPLCKMDVLDHVLALDYIASRAQQQQQQQQQQQHQARSGDEDNDNDEQEEPPDALYHHGTVAYSPWRHFWQGFIAVGPARHGGGVGRRRRHWTRVSTSLDHQHDDDDVSHRYNSNNSTIIAANEMFSNDQHQELELVETTSTTRRREETTRTASSSSSDTTVDDVMAIQIV
jgi:Ring finger domain